MTSIAKLKDKARKYEQKEDWQAAIQAYRKVLQHQESQNSLDLDLGLFNRIGDLNLRIGRTDEAVEYYEQAADKYAEMGFYNNAIALCNKALRHRPDHAAVYLKLSRLYNEQGFETDARRWILKYAEHQLAAGEVEEALAGLEEFAKLSDDPEVRELLAGHLAAHNHPEEAIDQLRSAYVLRARAGEMEKAAEIVALAREIDPDVDLESDARTSGALDRAPEPHPGRQDRLAGLAPLDAPPEAEVGTEAEETVGPDTETPVAEAHEEAGAGEEAARVDVEPELPLEQAGEIETSTGPMEGLETRTEVAETDEVDEVEGLESVGGAGQEEPEAEQLSGLEPSFSEQGDRARPGDADPGAVGRLEGLETDESAGADGDDAEPEPEPEPLPLLGGGVEGEHEEAATTEAEVEQEYETAAEPEEAPEHLEPEPGPGAEEEPAQGEPEPEPVHADAEADDAAGGGGEVGPVDPSEVRPVDEGPMNLDLSDAEPEAIGAAEPDEGTEDLEPLDLSFEGGVTGDMGLLGGGGAGELDLDLESLGLLAGTGAEGASISADDLDIDAVLERSRELVSRGLMSEALRELRLLSESDAEPAVFQDALAVVKEILRHDPGDIRALQRRVEYAARAGDRALQIDGYIDLADVLDRMGADAQAEALFRRALKMDPGNETAREFLGLPPLAEEEAAVEEPAGEPGEPGELEEDRGAEETEGSGEAAEPGPAAAATESREAGADLDADADDHLAILLDTAGPAEMTPVAGEPADPETAAMLEQFRMKVAEGAEPADAGDHYDLGLAFKEMGLVDEAIAEFRVALTGGEAPLKVYEELGQCFVLKGQYDVALKVLDRALQTPATDETELLGVYYQVGQCHEALGDTEEARAAYRKVLAMDPSFADVPDRMARL